MGRGAAAEIRPEELALHLGRIGVETALAARGAESLVMPRRGEEVIGRVHGLCEV